MSAQRQHSIETAEMQKTSGKGEISASENSEKEITILETQNCFGGHMKRKFDFGDLEPVAAKSEVQIKIETAMAAAEKKREEQRTEKSAFIPRTDEEREIAKDLNIIEKGQLCEKDIQYALTYLDRTRYRVIHNIFVHGKNQEGEPEDQEHDSIVVCNNMIFDIEAKSVTGDILTVCPDGQWEVKAGYKNYSVPNPLAQVERHRYNLQYRLGKLEVPLTEIVVTNNTRLLIRDEYKRLPYTLLKSDMLVEYIMSCVQAGPLDSRTALICQALVGGKRAPRRP